MMKTCILVFFIFFAINNLFSQTYDESFVACGTPFTTKIEIQPDNYLKVYIQKGVGDRKSIDYLIKPITADVFASFFYINFKSTFDSGCISSDSSLIILKARDFYIKTESLKGDTTPVAGNFIVRPKAFAKIQYHIIDSSGNITKFNTIANWAPLVVQKVEAEINNGFIQNLKAYIQYPDSTLHYFILPYPVGISSIDNFKKYSKSQLLELYSPLFNSKHSKVVINKKKAEARNAAPLFRVKLDSIYQIKLSDIIDYDYKLGTERRDYSPASVVINITGGSSVILNKEATKRLFEANIYSDFVGLKEDQPNGLVQVELRKLININTRQYLSPKFISSLFRSNGWFHFIAPAVTFSKIEQHNRNLILGDMDSIRLFPGNIDTAKINANVHRYTDPLNIYRYQWFSAGFDLNIMHLAKHDAKYEVAVNFGARLGITPLIDSLTTPDTFQKTGFTTETTLNTIQLFPEISARFLPEERFNFSLSNKLIYMLPINTKVQTIVYDKNDVTNFKPVRGSWLNTFELLMAIQVNPNNKVFGRVRLNWELDNIKSNFSQIQIGYSTYLLGGR